MVHTHTHTLTHTHTHSHTHTHTHTLTHTHTHTITPYFPTTLSCKYKSPVDLSIVKPTRCTSVLNLFYFGMALYMFRTVFPSVIRSSRPYIQQQAFIKQILLSAYQRPLASRQQYLFDKCMLLYVQSWTPDDGRKDRQKHVECHSKIK